MTIIEHVDLPASRATVWQVLTETDRYGRWNPFMVELSGRLAVGERLTVTIHRGRRSVTFWTTVLAIEDGTRIRWRVRPGVPGVLDGEQELRLEATPDDGNRFVHREVFAGLLIPAMRRVIDDPATGLPR